MRQKHGLYLQVKRIYVRYFVVRSPLCEVRQGRHERDITTEEGRYPNRQWTCSEDFEGRCQQWQERRGTAVNAPYEYEKYIGDRQTRRAINFSLRHGDRI